jgi:hypothetical protein
MVKLSHHLLSNFRLLNPDSGIIDLKAYYRGFRYVREMLKLRLRSALTSSEAETLKMLP